MTTRRQVWKHAEWTFKDFPAAPSPATHDELQLRYFWSDLFLEPSHQIDETASIWLTVCASGGRPAGLGDTKLKVRQENWREYAKWCEPDELAEYERLSLSSLDASLSASGRGLGETVVNTPDFSSYDLFRYSFVWLSALLNHRSIVLRHDDWALDKLEEPIRKDLADSGTIVHDECVAYLSRHPDHVPHIHPRKFEALIASVLRQLGYEVELTPRSWDGGKDIVAISRGSASPIITLVECKRYAKGAKVTVRHVRELLGVVCHERAHRGMIVTSADYSAPAARLAAAASPEIELIDGNELVAWLTAVANWELGDVPGLIQEPLLRQIDAR